MILEKNKLSYFLKQYRFEHIIQNDIKYRQVTISKHTGVNFRGSKLGCDIGRKRQFIINLEEYPNTLLFVRQGVADGSIGIAPTEVNGCIVTENMPMFSIENVNIDYFEIFIKSDYFKNKINKISTTGSAQKSIHEKAILNIKVNFHSPIEQEKIVSKMKLISSEVDTLLSEYNYQLNLINKLRQQLLKEAIQGKLVPQSEEDESASMLLKEVELYKEQLIRDKKIKKENPQLPIPKDQIPFKIPSNWNWCRLSAVGYLKRGKSKHRPRNDQRLFENGKYPFIQTGNVSSAKYTNHLILTVNNYYSEFGLRQSEIQPKGTLCITIAANIAECGFLDFEACVPDSIVCFNSVDSIIEKYILFFIKTVQEDLERYAPATAQKNINLGILSNVLVPLPPLAEQQRIVAKVDELMQLCDELETAIAKNQEYTSRLYQAALKDALQQPKTEVITKEKKANIIPFTPRYCDIPTRTILAGYIINRENSDSFGRVKFQKLLYLLEHVCKFDFNSQYVKKAAGPYDDQLIKDVESKLKQLQFYKIKQEGKNEKVSYEALGYAPELDNLFVQNFTDESETVNQFLDKFKNSSMAQCEIVATLYGVWNNRIIQKQLINDELLKKDFLEWDTQKIKYEARLDAALLWMREKNIVPDGYGKVIEKPAMII